MKIFRRTLLSISAIAFLLAASTSLATPKHHDKTYKDASPHTITTLSDGFYVGADAGYDSYRVKAGSGISDQKGNSIALSDQGSANGWAGGLFAGYGHYFNNFYYLGGEIFGKATSASGNFSSSALTTGPTIIYSRKISVNNEYGISLLPGLKVADNLLVYLRLGYGWTRVKLKETITSSVVPAPLTFNNSATRAGFHYGLGTEFAIIQHLSARGEFTHADYRSFTSVTGTTSKLADNQLMVGLIYHFA